MNVSIKSGVSHNERYYGRRMLRILSAALSYVLPRNIADEVAIEFDFSVRRALNSRTTRRQLAQLDGSRVNIGCGDRTTRGWVNIKLKSTTETYFWDCRRGLPFSDNW